MSAKKPDDAAATLDALRMMLSGTVRGLVRSGLFRVLAIIGALGTTFHDLCVQYIKTEAEHGGRVGYENAKSAVLNLSGLLTSDLASFCTQYEKELVIIETANDTGTRH